MRILTLSNCQLRASEGSGGIVLTMAEGLRQRGHTVDLVGPDDYEVAQWFRPRAISYRQACGMHRFVTQTLRRRSYDILEIYGGEAGPTFRRLRRNSSRPLLISHSNGLEPHVHRCLAGIEDTKPRWWQFDRSPWMAAGFRAADGIVVLSEFDREYGLHEGYQPPDRIATVTPGLHDAFIGLPLRVEREPVIGFCGNWLPRKGIKLIAEALPRVLREFPAARALLVGVGAKFSATEWFPADVLPRIEALPWVEGRPELIRQYQRMSCALMPSYYESFGLVAAEAMACGAVAIASKSGFGTSLHSGEDSLVVDPLTAEGLERAIRTVITDDALRRRLAAAGHNRAQTMGWAPAIEKLEKTYLGWLRESRSLS